MENDSKISGKLFINKASRSSQEVSSQVILFHLPTLVNNSAHFLSSLAASPFDNVTTMIMHYYLLHHIGVNTALCNVCLIKIDKQEKLKHSENDSWLYIIFQYVACICQVNAIQNNTQIPLTVDKLSLTNESTQKIQHNYRQAFPSLKQWCIYLHTHNIV